MLRIIFIVDVVVVTICLIGIFVCDMIDAYERRKYGKQLEEGLLRSYQEKTKEPEEKP